MEKCRQWSDYRYCLNGKYRLGHGFGAGVNIVAGSGIKDKKGSSCKNNPHIVRLLPAAAAAATGILVGSAMVATRFVIDQTAPASLALLRYLIGFFCLLPPVLMSARVQFERRDLAPIGLLGIIQFGILIALLNYGLQFIPSARAALIFATMPLLTMVLATILGYEKFTLVKTMGVLLTISGVAFALGEKAVKRGGPADQWIGELAVLASALSGAICSVLYRPYLRKYPTLLVSAFAMLASVGFLAILAWWEGFWESLPQFTPGGWLAVVFIGVSSGIGYYLWLWALNHTTPTKVTVFLALSPVTAAVLGSLLLAEKIPVMLIFGVACVSLGLWIARWEAREVQDQE
jgi:drug/metabolite transporter (DMT)-like permease